MDGSETNKSSLRNKKIACDVCKKSFKTESNLNVHKRLDETYKNVTNQFYKHLKSILFLIEYKLKFLEKI